MNIVNRIGLFLILACVMCFGSTELSNHTNHWVANSGGLPTNHAQNFISEMIIYNNINSPLLPKGQSIITASAWDEGGCGNCVLDKNTGLPIRNLDAANLAGSPEISNALNSDTARFGNLKCYIQNFWGRASYFKNVYVGHVGPPPSLNPPRIVCSNGDTIRSVVDPSALVFDNSGKLIVADNGPAQNLKIFTLNPPRIVRTFGDSGGIFARTLVGKNVYRRGIPGDRKLWGVRGLGVDSAGNLYVANTGISEQSAGGTNIRKYSSIDSSLVWQTFGYSFVNSSDADPASNGVSLDITGKRFVMDYKKSPGNSWKFVGTTYDQFRWPNDPRGFIPLQSVWTRRIQGKKFTFMSDMIGGYVYVVRFVDSSEVGIPTAFFCLQTDLQTGWGTDSAPTWSRGEATKRNRWYWVDRNGDGIMQKVEYGIWSNWNPYSLAVSVDDNGNIWLGGTGDTISTFGGDGGLTKITAGRVMSNGVLEFNMNSISRYSIPFEANNGIVVRLKSQIVNDFMFLASTPSSHYMDSIFVYSNFTNEAKRSLVCKVDLKYDDLDSANIILDYNTSNMTLPWSFTADNDFIYVTYLDRGLYSRRRGEVTVYSAKTCGVIGWLAPTSSTGQYSGAIDLVNAINVVDQTNGYKIIMVEEDGKGKVMVYRWKYK